MTNYTTDEILYFEKVRLDFLYGEGDIFNPLLPENHSSRSPFVAKLNGGLELKCYLKD